MNVEAVVMECSVSGTPSQQEGKNCQTRTIADTDMKVNGGLY